MTGFHDPNVIKVKRGLRKLYDEHPAAFEWFVAVLQRSGKHWRVQLPPMEKGVGTKPVQVDRELLAFLLATYRTRKGSRESFLDALAEGGCRYGNPYFVGVWSTPDAIEKHLRAAERLAAEDPAFEDEVVGWWEMLGDFAPEQGPVTG